LLISPETVERVFDAGNVARGVKPFETVAKTGVFLADPFTLEMKEVDGFLRGNYMIMFRPRVD